MRSLIDEIKATYTWKDRAADAVASTIGSWYFLIAQSIALFIWVLLNATLFGWDPYPFILMNLGLSLQAAYAAPIIMMSQNRQGNIDRKEAQFDYETNRSTGRTVQQIQDRLDEIVREQRMIREMLESLTDNERTTIQHKTSTNPPGMDDLQREIDQSLSLSDLMPRLP